MAQASVSACRNRAILDEPYTVRVRFQRPLSTCLREKWIACLPYFLCSIGILVLLGSAFIVFGLVWVLAYCYQPPGMALETLSIRNLTAHESTTSPGTTPQWQVDSAFAIRLSAWNPNTVAGCVSTYRRVLVNVEYKGQTVLQQEVPLGFGLKPRRSRAVTMEVKGENVRLMDPGLGPVMQAEIRSGNVTLDVHFDARCMISTRTALWVSWGCVVAASSPSNSSSALLQKRCNYNNHTVH